MYGGCYDVCTSRPPYTSPPCSLSSSTTDIYSSTTEPTFSTTESGYAIPTPAPEPGVAYTTDAPADSIAPAIDDSRALVMAEMPSVDADVPASSSAIVSTSSPDAGELSIENVPAEQALPTAEAETPQSLRSAAIAKLLADKIRKPKTENKPCWDDPNCKEVQLGIPSPLPSLVETSSESTAASTPESSPEAPRNLSEDAPTETSADTPPYLPAETPEEAPTGASTDVPAES
ncbi:hypothetical protein E8E11_004941 [Didymella keratinophila]|nr:hypothetical protein E8E11_004941 [Didymella keratinophila]